jgi:hypothetical protein
MNVIRRTHDRVLLSLTAAEFETVEHVLARVTSSAATEECLAQVRSRLGEVPISNDSEVLDAWADGASVQVRAITVYGDPVEMGTGEAQAFAERIRQAINDAG